MAMRAQRMRTMEHQMRRVSFVFIEILSEVGAAIINTDDPNFQRGLRLHPGVRPRRHSLGRQV